MHLLEDACLFVRPVVLVEGVVGKAAQGNLHGLGMEAILSVVHWVYSLGIDDLGGLLYSLARHLHANCPFHRFGTADKVVGLRQFRRIR